MLVIFCLLGLLAPSLAQIVTKHGACPRLTPIPQFVEDKLLGDWIEWSHVESYYEPDHACSHIKFYRDKDGYVILQARGLIRGPGTGVLWEGKQISAHGQLHGTYHMKFSKHSRDRGFTATYVAANWNHWLILHGCKEGKHGVEQFVWVFTKHYHLKQKHEEEIDRALKNIGIPPHKLSKIDHDNCPKHV